MTTIRPKMWAVTAMLAMLATTSGCSSTKSYQNKAMDFGSIRTVAVMPFWNMSRDQLAGARVRDVFSTMLLATEAVYVVPTGEMGRAISRIGLANPVAPTTEEVVKLGAMLKVEAVITGVVKEYGEVRGGNSTANVVSLSAQMFETSTGKVVWSGNSTKGGVTWGGRMLGTAGGDPVNDVTEQAVDDLLKQLFR
jgi:hypothetical protein